MKKIILLICLTGAINTFSQKLVKTYWDWSKTKLQAQYYTDAYGTKNGSFKGYSEYGGLLMQGVFKDGLPTGKWIENYVNGKLHYIKIHNIPGYSSLDVVDGKIISYYEDGKTIKYERNFKNGELDGVWKVYNQDGTLYEEDKYVNGDSENERKNLEKYNAKALEEQIKKNLLIKEETQKKNAENYKEYIENADNAKAAKDYIKAKSFYLSASNLSVNEQYPKDKIKEIETILEKNAQFKVKFDLQKIQIDALYNKFKTQYVTKKISFWPDPVTLKPVMIETYPKGENLYKQSDIIISELLTDYEAVIDGESEIIKGNYITSFLDKMISLSMTNTKQIEKQIIKAQTDEEVRNILGIK